MIDLAHASIIGITCKATGTWKITLETQELSPDDVVKLTQSLTETKQLDTRIDPTVEGKTPSQRLYNVLYRVWEMECENDFKDYYNKEMEKITNHYKAKLP